LRIPLALAVVDEDDFAGQRMLLRCVTGRILRETGKEKIEKEKIEKKKWRRRSTTWPGALLPLDILGWVQGEPGFDEHDIRDQEAQQSGNTGAPRLESLFPAEPVVSPHDDPRRAF
jgi:hypothetical protein